MSYATSRVEHFRSSATLTTTTSAHNTTTTDLPTSALVLDFICLFTHDLRRRHKRWQDGKLKYHTFNKRVMVYDDRGHFVGDAHWPGDRDLCQGEELDLDRGGAIVQVEECVGSREQDLREVLEKRGRDVEGRREAAAERTLARTPSKPLAQLTGATPASVTGQPRLPGTRPRSNPHMIHRPLHSVLRSPGPIGRASLPDKSPFDIRQTAQPVLAARQTNDDRALKRQRITRSPPAKRQGHAQDLFGTRLNLSATPASLPLVRAQVLQDATNLQPGPESDKSERKEVSGPSRQQANGTECHVSSHVHNAVGEVARGEQLLSTTPVESGRDDRFVMTTARVANERGSEPPSEHIVAAPTSSGTPGEPSGVERHQLLNDAASSPPMRGYSATNQAKESVAEKRRRVLAPNKVLTGATTSRSGKGKTGKAGTRKGSRSPSPLLIHSDNNDESQHIQALNPRKPAAPKPLHKSKNLTNGRQGKDKNEALNVVGQCDASISSLPPLNKTKAEQVMRQPAQDRGPRAELRIRPRKKRGLLLTSERLISPPPRASNTIQELVQHDDGQSSLGLVPGGIEDMLWEQDDGKQSPRRMPAESDLHDDDQAVVGENFVDELPTEAHVEIINVSVADTAVICRPVDSIDHMGHIPANTNAAGPKVLDNATAERQFSGHETLQLISNELSIEAAERISPIRPSSSDGSSEGDVGFEAKPQKSFHEQASPSLAASETDSNVGSPADGGLESIGGHGDEREPEGGRFGADESDASLDHRRTVTQRNRPRISRDQTNETSVASLKQPLEPSAQKEERPSERRAPRMQLRKMGSNRCKEIIGWVPQPPGSAFVAANGIPVDDKDVGAGTPEPEEGVAEHTRSVGNSDGPEAQTRTQTRDLHGVTNNEAALQREDLGIQPDHHHNSCFAVTECPKGDLSQIHQRPKSAGNIVVGKCDCAYSGLERQGSLADRVDESSKRKDQESIELSRNATNSPPPETLAAVAADQKTQPNAIPDEHGQGAEETDKSHLTNHAINHDQDKQSMLARTSTSMSEERNSVMGGGVISDTSSGGEEPVPAPKPQPPAAQQRSTIQLKDGSKRGVQSMSVGSANGFSWASDLPKETLLEKHTKARKGVVTNGGSQRPFSFKPVRNRKTDVSETGGEEPKEKRQKTATIPQSSSGGAWSRHAFDLLGIGHPRNSN